MSLASAALAGVSRGALKAVALASNMAFLVRSMDQLTHHRLIDSGGAMWDTDTSDWACPP